MEPRLVALGGLLLYLSCLTLIETGALAVQTPLYLVAAASLLLALGSLLAEGRLQDRPA